MKSVLIQGKKREAVGKKNSKLLRSQGNVPCVLYGGEEPIHFYAEFNEFRKVFYTPNVYLIDLEIDGKQYKAMVQDKQWHPVEEQLLHVDFLEVNENKPVKIEVPVKIEGLAIGIQQGGKLYSNLRRLRIKAYSKDLPDYIEVDVTKLGIGDSIKVGDLTRDNIQFLNDKTNVVVGVIVTRIAKAAAADEEEGEEEEGEEGAEAEESSEATE